MNARSRVTASTLVAGLVVAVLTALAGPAQAAPVIRVDVINFDPSGADTGENWHLNREWVRIKNNARVVRDITGWTVRDPSGHVYKFPKTILQPGGTVTLRTGKGTNQPGVRYWNKTWYVWNNTGDTASLRNAASTVVHSCSYYEAANVQKVCA